MNEHSLIDFFFYLTRSPDSNIRINQKNQPTPTPKSVNITLSQPPLTVQPPSQPYPAPTTTHIITTTHHQPQIYTHILNPNTSQPQLNTLTTLNPHSTPLTQPQPTIISLNPHSTHTQPTLLLSAHTHCQPPPSQPQLS